MKKKLSKRHIIFLANLTNVSAIYKKNAIFLNSKLNCNNNKQISLSL